MKATRTNMITGGKEKRTDVSYDLDGLDVGQEGNRKARTLPVFGGVRWSHLW